MDIGHIITRNTIIAIEARISELEQRSHSVSVRHAIKYALLGGAIGSALVAGLIWLGAHS